MATVLDLSALALRGFTVQGDAAFDLAGVSVSNAGDVNGDGFDDVIVGAPYNDGGTANSGRAYIIFGGPGGSDTIDLGNLDGTDGFFVQGAASADHAGIVVSAAGDINGDGFDDVIVGALSGGGFYYGGTPRAYVVFGEQDPDSIDLSALSPSDGFVINGTATYYGGAFSVSDAGDVNGDGFDDIIIGSPNDNGYAGSAYVIFGKAGGFGKIDLPTLPSNDGFRITGN